MHVMRLPFSSKRHLKYDSIGAWYEGERVPQPPLQIKDQALRDKYFQQYVELWAHLFSRSLKALPKHEQDMFANGTRPSQSHRFADAAKPYLAAFREQLPNLEEIHSVELAFLQGDKIGFLVMYKRSPGQMVLWRKPMYYRGFEVRYGALDLIPPEPEDTGLATYHLTQGGLKKVERRS
jgi:hypothetical protein